MEQASSTVRLSFCLLLCSIPIQPAEIQDIFFRVISNNYGPTLANLRFQKYEFSPDNYIRFLVIEGLEEYTLTTNSNSDPPYLKNATVFWDRLTILGVYTFKDFNVFAPITVFGTGVLSCELLELEGYMLGPLESCPDSRWCIQSIDEINVRVKTFKVDLQDHSGLSSGVNNYLNDILSTSAPSYIDFLKGEFFSQHKPQIENFFNDILRNSPVC